jgi:transporter family protein
MQIWMLYAGLSLTFWGLWGYFGKMASATMPAKSVFIVEAVVAVLVAAVWLAASGFKMQSDPKGLFWAALTGLTLGLGQLFFFLALSRGKASLVFGITALYPLITIALALALLKEQVTWTQGLGILLAAIALPLMSF